MFGFYVGYFLFYFVVCNVSLSTSSLCWFSSCLTSLFFVVLSSVMTLVLLQAFFLPFTLLATAVVPSRSAFCPVTCVPLTVCIGVPIWQVVCLKLESPTFLRKESDMELNNNIISYIFIHSFHVSGDSVGLRCLAFNWCAHCGLPGAHQHRVGGFWSKSYWP